MASKTTTIKGIAQVDDTGSGCVGNMSWETPYVKFKVYENENSNNFVIVFWQSENIDDILRKQDKQSIYKLEQQKNAWYDFEAFCRPCGKGEYQIWRIKNIEYR